MSTLCTVLLADDSPHAQRMGERILREEGYEVVTVTDGETAILRVKDVNPDVVIVDAFLPQVSGYDLCGFIKKQPQHSHVRVLLTSTALERVDEDQMYQAGADGQLKKPFEASVMLKSLKDLISGSDKDSKKKRSGSTFDLGSYQEEGERARDDNAEADGDRASEKSGVSPLKAWLEQHDDDGPAGDKDADPLGIREPAHVGASVAAASDSVSLSNPQLLRNAQDEPEDLSLRNNPVAKLRNVPPPAPDSASKLQSISGRTQDSDAPPAPSTRSFRIASKVTEEEPLVKEQPDAEPSEPAARPRRSLLDALAEYENDAAVLDTGNDPLEAEVAAVEAVIVEEEVPAGIETEPEPEVIPETEAEVAVAEEPAAEAEAATELTEPEHEIDAGMLAEAAASVAAQGQVEKLALAAAGVRLDEEEIRAVVEIAVSASMSAIVDEVTRCVTLALEARYRHANEAPADKASD
ncbi:MAG: response regulator [Bryobacterales bacterium]|nr:response regulator [Bryobacterales bacterium]